MWNWYNSLEMTFQPYTRTWSWGALVVSRKESYCRRNILRKVNFRLMCSMFRINADTASSNMLSRSIRVIPSAFTKREVSHSPLVCCFCMFKGTTGKLNHQSAVWKTWRWGKGSRRKWLEWCRSLPAFGSAECCVSGQRVTILFSLVQVFMLIFAFWKETHQVRVIVRNRKFTDVWSLEETKQDLFVWTKFPGKG